MKIKACKCGCGREFVAKGNRAYYDAECAAKAVRANDLRRQAKVTGGGIYAYNPCDCGNRKLRGQIMCEECKVMPSGLSDLPGYGTRGPAYAEGRYDG